MPRRTKKMLEEIKQKIIQELIKLKGLLLRQDMQARFGASDCLLQKVPKEIQAKKLIPGWTSWPKSLYITKADFKEGGVNMKLFSKKKRVRKVCIESPYAGDIQKNMLYLKYCIRDSIYNYYENPYASHSYLPNCLDDSVKEERLLGIKLGLQWGDCADIRVYYVDLGVTPGMITASYHDGAQGRTGEVRRLSEEDYAEFEVEWAATKTTLDSKEQ